MTTIKYALAFVFGLMLFSIPLWADPPGRAGRVSFIEGTVTFSSNDSGESQAAALNYPLTAGDQLQTAAGARAEAQIGSAAIRLAGDTHLTLDALDDQAVQLRLDTGSISIRLRRLDADQRFDIVTQTASVSLPVPGSFRIDQEDNGDMTVTARSGDADVTTGQATVNVKSGQALSVPVSDPARYTLSEASAPDSWDLWVASRDRGSERGVSSRYVSSELEGIEDLDAEGTWRVFEGYGPCWVPMNVFAGWAPYHFGRWVWVGPWGWTWIDDAPWGFAPFHYGRWAFTAGIWVWVPGRIVRHPVYAPALVTWKGGMPGRGHPPDRDHITWIPLRPRQPFRPAYPVGADYPHAINGGGVAVHRPFVRPVPNDRIAVVRPETRGRVTPIAPQERPVRVRPVSPQERPVRVAPVQPQERPVRVRPVSPQERPVHRAPPPNQGDPELLKWRQKGND